MAAKDDRISFRTGDVRRYNIAEYKTNYTKSTGKKITNTDIMIEAIDLFLENEDSGLTKNIKDYEDIIIKIILGVNRKDFKSEEKYLESLETKIRDLKEGLVEKD